SYLVSRAISKQAKVALGGDGGDELFGGYNHYSFLLWQERARAFLPASLRRWAGTAFSRRLPLGFRGRNHLIGYASDLPYSIAHINMYFDAMTRAKLLAPLMSNTSWSEEAPELYKVQLCRSHHAPLQQSTRVDFQTTLVDAYLTKVDRASMLSSLEVRSPWLDPRI